MKNILMYTVLGLITVILVFVMLIRLINDIGQKIEENRCYNLPLNEYKEDKRCMKLNKD